MANNFRPIPTQESVALSLGSSSPSRSCGVCSDESLQSDPRYVEPLSSGQSISSQLVALGQLEFRKAFLILSYLGRYKLEETISVEFIKQIQSLNMNQFESVVWEELGSKCIPLLDR
ncbi:putative RNA-dependent RNA polymerase 3 [Curcuma longa]|uniref:putative RNA-dependent RNA polymerase 3 n=1 Tax=Curcuma longa TaxID=136217 RepID=UPI003D9E1BAF